ncbi:hypothetical protein AB6D11_00650 [Vibrio splendidus]
MYLYEHKDMSGIVRERFQHATQSLRNGEDPTLVFQSTGCFMTPDGHVLWEIDDEGVCVRTAQQLLLSIQENMTKLAILFRAGDIGAQEAKSQLLDLREQDLNARFNLHTYKDNQVGAHWCHPSLSVQRGDVFDWALNRYEIETSVMGFCDPLSRTPTIFISQHILDDESKGAGVVAHELTHWLQCEVGAATGGDIQEFHEYGSETHIKAMDDFRRLNFKPLVKAARQWVNRNKHGTTRDILFGYLSNIMDADMLKVLNQHALCLDEGESPFQAYRSLLGEMVAHDVQARLYLSADERRETPPLSSQESFMATMRLGAGGQRIKRKVLELICEQVLKPEYLPDSTSLEP